MCFTGGIRTNLVAVGGIVGALFIEVTEVSSWRIYSLELHHLACRRNWN